MNFHVTIQRRVPERTNDETLRKQVQYIADRSISGSRGYGWEFEIGKIGSYQSGDWTFTCKIRYTKASGRGDAWKRQWSEILQTIIAVGHGTKHGKYPWVMIEPKMEKVDKIPVKSRSLPTDDDLQKTYAPIKLENAHFFDHIYDRDPHIQLALKAIEAAKDSGMENRFHCVMWGPPGCGKSEILKALCEMLGPEGSLKLDATSTTKAGIERHLLNVENTIPPVLAIEEIEKCPESDLRWLLAVLDTRAEIRKLNYRINSTRSVPMLCIATVNNMRLFKDMLAGALASRFPNKIYCPVPSRKVLYQILEREVKKSGGNTRWIDPTLKFAYDEMKMTDPRAIIPICLQGKNDLLTGKYQEWYRATQEPDDKKE